MSDIKLKEIKPGMVINCPTEEVAEKLFKHLDGLGYKWFSNGGLLTENTIYYRHGKNTCCFINENKEVIYGDIGYFKNRGLEITEFSDLIEPELTAEEVLSILGEMIHECDNDLKCDDCPLSCVNVNNGEKQDLCDRRAFKWNEQKIIEICKQWKADHEKKEPEVELQEAARPLVEYLKKNYHPHATAIVSLDYAEVLEGKESAKYGEEV